MPSDLERILIDGGLHATAAKALSNALDNAKTGEVSTGRKLTDATPLKQMRLIDSDTRRYTLTNLDHVPTPDQPIHPYADSQPASATGTLATPSVVGGQFVQITPQTAGGVAQSQVTLRLANRGGQHARLNLATGEVECVPLTVVCEPQSKCTATVEEKSDSTVITLTFL